MLLPAPVVDTVVRSTSGFDLIDDSALASLIKTLFPLSRVVTPNIPEAARITGLTIEDEVGMRRAADSIRKMGARAVLVKGGHLKRQDTGCRTQDSENVSQVIDVLDDEGNVTVFRGEWIDSTSTHGTGCTLSAAITARLSQGADLVEAVAISKRFVADAIRNAPNLGHGAGPLNHNVPLRFEA
jgi:hydroxymethylpyrimidine kinase/phosphomethylpyrimidine kinase